MNIPSAQRIATIVPIDAMILPHDATLTGMTFSERDNNGDLLRRHIIVVNP
jgi:hypothetical protein